MTVINPLHLMLSIFMKNNYFSKTKNLEWHFYILTNLINVLIKTDGFSNLLLHSIVLHCSVEVRKINLMR